MQSYFETLAARRNLSRDDARRLFAQIFEGKLDAAQLAACLTALKMKGETPEEIEGAANAMVNAATRFPRPRGFEIGEIVGTGGDGAQTINVSTTTALIAAGMGLHIAKHGNRGVSSKSGASDLLNALGVDIRPTPEESSELLTRTGFCFCFAQLYHPAMRFAGPVRASLRTRTIFNILGPLTNPARPDYALIGVYDPALLETVAATLRELGMKRAFVVHGGGLDEVAVHADTDAVELTESGELIRRRFTPQDFGIVEPHALEDLQGGDPADNAEITLALLSGRGTRAQKDFIAANLSLLLLLGHRAKTLPEALAMARHGIALGCGLKTLEAHQAFSEAHRKALGDASARKAA